MGSEIVLIRPTSRGHKRCLAVSHPPDGAHGVGLEDYVLRWGADGDELAVALGCGSLDHHSPTPNAAFTTRLTRGGIVFRAVRDVAEGEQILIDYEWPDAEYAAFWR